MPAGGVPQCLSAQLASRALQALGAALWRVVGRGAGALRRILGRIRGRLARASPTGRVHRQARPALGHEPAHDRGARLRVAPDSPLGPRALVHRPAQPSPSLVVSCRLNEATGGIRAQQREGWATGATTAPPRADTP